LKKKRISNGFRQIASKFYIKGFENRNKARFIRKFKNLLNFLKLYKKYQWDRLFFMRRELYGSFSLKYDHFFIKTFKKQFIGDLFPKNFKALSKLTGSKLFNYNSYKSVDKLTQIKETAVLPFCSFYYKKKKSFPFGEVLLNS
jgi:hypothetical protein